MKNNWIKKILFSIIPIAIYILFEAIFIGIYYLIKYKTGHLETDFIVSYNKLFLWLELLLFLISLISFYITKKKALNWITIKKIDINHIMKYIVIAVISNILITLFLYFMRYDINFTNIDVNTYPLLSLLILGICTPITEEIIYRYYVYNILNHSGSISPEREEKQNNTAAIIDGILFALVHNNIMQMGYSFAFGYIFSKLDEKENSILPGIIMHITINITSIIITLFFAS